MFRSWAIYLDPFNMSIFDLEFPDKLEIIRIPGARLRQQLLWSDLADWAAGGWDQHHPGRGIVRQTGLLHTLQVTTQHQNRIKMS